MKEGIWGTEWKEKGTGKFITVSSSISSSKGRKVRYYTGSGTSFEVPEKEFYQKYEPVEYEDIYQRRSLGPALVEACLGSSEYRRLADSMLRRLEPGYYEVGVIVYFESSYPYFRYNQSQGYIEFGVDNPFEIVSIRYHGESDQVKKVGLVRLGKKAKDEPDYEIPMYLGRIEPGDVFFSLRRYDKPF